MDGVFNPKGTGLLSILSGNKSGGPAICQEVDDEEVWHFRGGHSRRMADALISGDGGADELCVGHRHS